MALRTLEACLLCGVSGADPHLYFFLILARFLTTSTQDVLRLLGEDIRALPVKCTIRCMSFFEICISRYATTVYS
jgi:hypothetical protein